MSLITENIDPKSLKGSSSNLDKYLRGDGTWQEIVATGGESVDGIKAWDAFTSYGPGENVRLYGYSVTTGDIDKVYVFTRTIEPLALSSDEFAEPGQYVSPLEVNGATYYTPWLTLPRKGDELAYGDKVQDLTLLDNMITLTTDKGEYSIDVSGLGGGGEAISDFILNGNAIELTTDQGTRSVDLSAILGDIVSGLSLDAKNLILTTDKGTHSVDLQPLFTQDIGGGGGSTIIVQGTADPTVEEVASGNYAFWKNTTTGKTQLWYNDNGIMKNIDLTILSDGTLNPDRITSTSLSNSVLTITTDKTSHTVDLSSLGGGTSAVTAGASDPTTTDIIAGNYLMWKNTTTGKTQLWYNDNDTLKSVDLTTLSDSTLNPDRIASTSLSGKILTIATDKGSYTVDLAPLFAQTNNVTTNKVTTTGTGLILEQTGDSNGGTRVQLQNRSTLIGMIVENLTSTEAIDISLGTQSGNRKNIRYENRAGNKLTSNTLGEIQIHDATNGITQRFGTSASSMLSSLALGYNNTTPSNYKLDVWGNAKITNGIYVQYKTGAPTLGELPGEHFMVWKSSTDMAYKLYFNDGAIKHIDLTNQIKSASLVGSNLVFDSNNGNKIVDLSPLITNITPDSAVVSFSGVLSGGVKTINLPVGTKSVFGIGVDSSSYLSPANFTVDVVSAQPTLTFTASNIGDNDNYWGYAIKSNLTVPNPIDMEFVFMYGFSDVFTATIGTRQAAIYTTNILSNVATVEYRKNNNVVTLPFALLVGDVLKVTITRTTLTLGSIVTITT